MNGETPRPKTFEEHREFMGKFIRAMLFLAWNIERKSPGEGPKTFRERLMLFEKLGFAARQGSPPQPDFSDPAWVKCEKELLDLLDECRDDPHAGRFESRAFHAVRPLMEENAAGDYARDMQPRVMNAGSLKYDPPHFPDHPTWCTFHIANAIAPRSIFEDRAYLPGCFLTLMEKSEKEYGFDTLQTFTWLNSRPRWLALFPREWHDSMEPPYLEVGSNYGFWGQLISARKTFNEKAGRLLYETGELPYKPRFAHAPFAAMRAHLEAYLRG